MGNKNGQEHTDEYWMALESVARERRFQDEQWGHERELPALLWNAILQEEAGEVSRETIPPFGNSSNPYRLWAELRQVAAVSIAWMEAIARERPDIAHALRSL